MATEFKLIHEVRNGLPFVVFTTLRAKLELSKDTLTRLIGLSPDTLRRRKRADRFTLHEGDALLRVARVFSATYDFFEAEGKARRWLKLPALAFAGRTPISLLDTEVGAQEVLRLLCQLEYGVLP